MADRSLPPAHRREPEYGALVEARPAGGLTEPTAPWSPEGTGGFDWRRYVTGLWRHKWIVVVLASLGVAAGVVAYRATSPLYMVESTVWVQSTAQRGDDPAPIRSGELLSSYAWIDLLRSFAVLDPVVEELGLFVTPRVPADSTLVRELRIDDAARSGEFSLEVDAAGREMVLRDWRGAEVDRAPVGAAIGSPAGLRWTPPVAQLTPGRRASFMVTRPRDVSRQLASDLDIRMDPQQNFMRIVMRGTDPIHDTRVVNAVTERFVSVAAQLKRAKLDEMTEILSEQLTYAQENLEGAEFALQNFQVQTISLPSQPSTPVAPGLQQTTDPVFQSFFNMKLEEEELRRDELALRTAVAQGEQQGRVPVESLEMIPRVRESSDVMSALSLANEKRAELRALSLRYTDEHPSVVELREDLTSLESETIPALLSNVLDEVRGRQAAVGGFVDQAAQELRQIPPRAIEEARLERARASAENLFRDLQQRFESARLGAVSTIPDVQVLDRAIAPERPQTDPRPRLFLMATLAGLGLGVAGALLRDRLDRRVRYPDQVTRELGLPILGTIPHLKGRNGRMNTDSQERVVESFRDLRLAVTYAHAGSAPLALTITSPGAGDGKTFCTTNLALAFAEMGKRTLVIDGDVRRGTVHAVFPMDRKPGLTDYLAGQASLEDIVRESEHASLWLLPSGSRFRDGPELLGSPTMGVLLQELGDRFDVILIDSAPLGAAVDPFILSTLSGSMLLVLRNGVTDREIASARLTTADRLPIHVLGAVLNDVPPGGLYRYYSYLPGYGVSDEGTSSGQDRLLVAHR